jgi:nicotinate-nucleotide--dimethylbenzimidazole phosphoribosyltransferase
VLERLAQTLAGAQHTPAPRAARRTLVVAAGDHGAGDPGIALGPEHPTIVAARAIDAGTAALAQVARAGRLPIVLVDAGVAEPDHMPAVTVRLARAPSRDIMREPAMTVVDATLALEAGIALAITLTEAGLDVLVLGALGVGSEITAAALAGAISGTIIPNIADPVAELASARGIEHARDSGLELLARFGGPETAVLAGAILAAASMNIAVVLDGHATAAAALVATRLAPHARGYLVAAHAGATYVTGALGLAPIFDVGLGHGEGTGAAMCVPLLDQVAALVATG